jgi:hypothetical protein
MFKVGDKVKCINVFDNCPVNLTTDKTYIIKNYYPSMGLTSELIELEGFGHRLKASRFIIDEDYYRRIKILKIKERINNGIVR